MGNCPQCGSCLGPAQHFTQWDEFGGDVLRPYSFYRCDNCRHELPDYDDAYEYLPDEFYPSRYEDADPCDRVRAGEGI